MGMYTEVFARARISPTGARTLRRAIATHRDPWTDGTAIDPHPFWATERWAMLLFGSSAYTPATRPLEVFTRNAFPHAVNFFEFAFLSSLKNYDNEAELFFEWLATVTDEDGFVGYTLYEEARTPTLYYIDSETGKVSTS